MANSDDKQRRDNRECDDEFRFDSEAEDETADKPRRSSQSEIGRQEKDSKEDRQRSRDVTEERVPVRENPLVFVGREQCVATQRDEDHRVHAGRIEASQAEEQRDEQNVDREDGREAMHPVLVPKHGDERGGRKFESWTNPETDIKGLLRRVMGGIS